MKERLSFKCVVFLTPSIGQEIEQLAGMVPTGRFCRHLMERGLASVKSPVQYEDLKNAFLSLATHNSECAERLKSNVHCPAGIEPYACICGYDEMKRKLS